MKITEYAEVELSEVEKLFNVPSGSEGLEIFSGETNDGKRVCFAHWRREVGDLESLIGEVTEFAKDRVKRFGVDPSKTDVGGLIFSALAGMRNKAEHERVRLEREANPSK